MSHVTLIRPPAVCSRNAYSAGSVPPLGLAYVAAALETAGHQVTVIDAVGEAPLRRGESVHPRLATIGLSIDEIVARIPARTEAIGLSVMFSQQWPDVEALAKAVRARFPDVPVFAGGEHITATAKWVLETCPAVTVCVLGEGEETAVELAEWIAGRRPLASIRGIAARREGQVFEAERRARIKAVDEIARPAWHHFPLEAYLSHGLGHGVRLGRSMPVLATRGCPYQCTFCSSPLMWTTRYSARDPKKVVDEIVDAIDRYAITNVDFYDLTAIIKREWILAFCAELERRQVSITFQLPSGTRSEALDEEVLAALHRTGCRNITYAPESGSERTLRLIKKKVKPERLLSSMRTASRLGIAVKANLMIGFPDETRADVARTIHFALRAAWAGVEDQPLFPFIPYPGSELHRELLASGDAPPLGNDAFAELGYADMTQARSYSRHFGDAEMNVYRVLGMVATYATSALRRPSRPLRMIRNVLKGRSQTVLEQRLVELFERRFAVRPQ